MSPQHSANGEVLLELLFLLTLMSGLEHESNLKQTTGILLPGGVFLRRFDQTRAQTGTHNGLFRRHGVGQNFGLKPLALVQNSFDLGVDKAISHDLLEAKTGQTLAQLALTVLQQIYLSQGQTHRWLGDRDVVVPINSAHFFNQICFYGDIKTMRRGSNFPLDAVIR